MRVQLGGVPETLLWTLYHRAIEARRADAVLADPVAVSLVDRIDYPFADRFGSGEGGMTQWQAVRDPTRGIMITAQGLLMYFSRDEVHGLVRACAERFGGAWMVFDAIPRWLAERSAKAGGLSRSDGTGGGYRAPPCLGHPPAPPARRVRWSRCRASRLWRASGSSAAAGRSTERCCRRQRRWPRCAGGCCRCGG